MYPHRIRLRGPWDFKPVERLSGETLPVPGKMTMPCHWKDGGLENFAGSVQFTRKFGYPGQIDSFERVWLTFEGLSENATVTLNGKELGSVVEKDCPHEFEITSHLQKRNELNVILFSSHPEGGLWGEVALEIRRTAFLKNCQAKIVPEGSSSKIVATGKIVGSSERPLDL